MTMLCYLITAVIVLFSISLKVLSLIYNASGIYLNIVYNICEIRGHGGHNQKTRARSTSSTKNLVTVEIC